MIKITIRVVCLLGALILALIPLSFASDDKENGQLEAFRDRFKTMQTEADKLWIRVDSSPPDDDAAVRLLLQESHALSRRFLEFSHEVQKFDLTRQQVYKKRLADSDAFLFLGAAASEMPNVLESQMSFMTDRRAIFLTAANKHKEIVDMFIKASQNVKRIP